MSLAYGYGGENYLEEREKFMSLAYGYGGEKLS